MCGANMDVFDVYPLSASYPNGTVDITHYRNEAFFAAESELERYVMAGLKDKTKPVCIKWRWFLREDGRIKRLVETFCIIAYWS